MGKIISGDTVKGRTITADIPIVLYISSNMIQYKKELKSELEKIRWIWVESQSSEQGNKVYFYTERKKITLAYIYYSQQNTYRAYFQVIGVNDKAQSDRARNVESCIKLYHGRGCEFYEGEKSRLPAHTKMSKIYKEIVDLSVAFKKMSRDSRFDERQRGRDERDYERRKREYGEELKELINLIEEKERQTKPLVQINYLKMEAVESYKIRGIEYKFSISKEFQNMNSEDIQNSDVIISKEPVIEDEEMQLKGRVTDVNLEDGYIIVAFQNTVDFGRFPQIGYINKSEFNIAYKIQNKVVNDLVNDTSVNKDILNILLNNSYKEIVNGDYSIENSQKRAIDLAVKAEDFLLVQGPPGTGKTTIIMEMIKGMIAQNKKVLISSKNNLAVDNVLSKCIDEGISCVRLGKEESVKISEVKERLLDRVAVNLQKDIVKNCDKEELEAIEEKEKQQKYVTILKEVEQEVYRYYEIIKKKKRLEKKLKIKKVLFNFLFSFYLVPIAFKKIKSLFNKNLSPEDKKIEKYKDVVQDKLMNNKKYKVNHDKYLESLDEIHGLSTEIDERLKPLANYKTFDYKNINQAKCKTIITSENDLAEKLSRKVSIIGNWKGDLEERQQSLYPVLLNSVQVIGATCIGVDTNVEFKDVTFDATIVDEAGQITIFDILVPISRSKKIILIGDHKQLPPIADTELIDEIEEQRDEDSNYAIKDVKQLMEKSLFEILFNEAPADHKIMLDTQFRMHPVISQFISDEFYESKYKSGLKPENRQLQLENFCNPLYFVDTKDLEENIENTSEEDGHTVYFNSTEAKIISKMCLDLIKEKMDPKEIGIITPYKKQKLEIQKHIREALGTYCASTYDVESIMEVLEIDTVDSFQGRDKNIVLYSFTRSNDEGKIGFLKELRRLNVTMTRAKYLLIMVGNSKTLTSARDRESRKCFINLISYVKNYGVYKVLGGEFNE